MKKSVLLASGIWLVLGLAVSAFGQCKLPLEKSPALSGVRLGMTKAEVVGWFGKPFTDEPDHIGYIGKFPVVKDGKLTFLSPTHYQGLKQVGITLEADAASKILIYYDSKIEWNSDEEFAAMLSENLKLPNAWTYEDGKATLWCDAWSLTSDAERNMVILSNLAPIKKAVDDDRAKKRNFKP